MLACKVRKWGNSYGVVIPKKVMEELHLREQDDVLIQIERKENPLKELFGAFPDLKSGKEIMKEIRKDKWSKYL